MKIQVREQLNELQMVLQQYQLWEDKPPAIDKLASQQPFAIDTLTATQWLQWIFIPKMHTLLDSNGDLPKSIAISPYLEESLSGEVYLTALLKPVLQIERLLKA